MVYTDRRKTLSKDTAREWLSDVPPEKVFLCNDGRALGNLQDLSSALRIMSPETFRHHVTVERNDFSDWIANVIGDADLARRLRETTDRAVTSRRVEERLTQLRITAWLRDRG